MTDYVSEPSVLEVKSIEPGGQPIEAIGACDSRVAQYFDISDPITEMREMLEVSDIGEHVVWPVGMSGTGARRQLAEPRIGER